MTTVSLARVDGSMDEAFGRAMALADCAGAVGRGRRVVIKPNWNACGLPGSTNLSVVLAACRWAYSRGAGEVIVGEGPVPVGRERIALYFDHMGVAAALDKAGARFVNLDDDQHVLFRNRPDLPAEIGVARLALECDVLINIPILKVHSCCLTTLCVKNLKGCLRPDDKMAFHRIGLLPAIVALNRIVPSPINVIDALHAMEGDHNNGRMIPFGLLIAGRDRVATDAVGSALIGFSTGQVPLLKLASRAGLGECRLDRIAIAGEPLVPQRVERPQDFLRRRYPGLGIQDDGACSACQAALMDGLYTAGNKRKAHRIAMGSKSMPAPGTLVLGDCLKSHFPTCPHVPGCPPDGVAVARALEQETP